jgi:hypothetical protein
MEDIINKIRIANTEKIELDNQMMELYIKTHSDNQEALENALIDLRYYIETGKHFLAELNKEEHL